MPINAPCSIFWGTCSSWIFRDGTYRSKALMPWTHNWVQGVESWWMGKKNYVSTDFQIIISYLWDWASHDEGRFFWRYTCLGGWNEWRRWSGGSGCWKADSLRYVGYYLVRCWLENLGEKLYIKHYSLLQFYELLRDKKNRNSTVHLTISDGNCLTIPKSSVAVFTAWKFTMSQCTL